MVEVSGPAKEERAATVQCINIAVIGDMSTGKSCLTVRFVEEDIDPEILRNSTATIGISTMTKDTIVDGKKVNVLLWDTAGMERFRSLARSYYRRADALLLVYDVTNRASFDALPSWYAELRDHAPEGAVTAVVGTKVDQDDRREVSYQDGHRFAQEHDSLFFEASALTGAGVAAPFAQLIQRALAAKPPAYPPRRRAARGPAQPASVRLSTPAPARGGKASGCC